MYLPEGFSLKFSDTNDGVSVLYKGERLGYSYIPPHQDKFSIALQLLTDVLKANPELVH